MLCCVAVAAIEWVACKATAEGEQATLAAWLWCMRLQVLAQDRLWHSWLWHESQASWALPAPVPIACSVSLVLCAAALSACDHTPVLQVCNTYGVLRNDEALLQYGFVLPEQPPQLCAIDYHDYR